MFLESGFRSASSNPVSNTRRSLGLLIPIVFIQKDWCIPCCHSAPVSGFTQKSNMASADRPLFTSRRSSSSHDLILQGRDAPPQHHSFRIESFSMLSCSSFQSLISNQFESGGYQWKLVIYPKGKPGGGEDHISIYLALSDTKALPAGWQVNAIFNLFVYNHVSDEYFSFHDCSLRRFHANQMELGYQKFIALPTFSAPSNGFLLGDSCVFGAEVFVVQEARKGEELCMKTNPIIVEHTWNIKNFSTVTVSRLESEPFTGGGYNWQLVLYPNGNGDGQGNSISLFLKLDRSTLPSNNDSIYADYTLTILNQNTGADNHVVWRVQRIFCHSTPAWGLMQFLSLSKFKDPNNGFLVRDSCTVKAKVTIVGIAKQVS